MPERLTLARHDHGPDHADWLAQCGTVHVRDIYPGQVAELAGVRLPGGSARARENFISGYEAKDPGVWSYYPWRNVALRTVAPAALFELRTNRNRNLITSAEQAVLQRAHVAVAGLSVGSNLVSALLRHGIGSTFSLADHDELATSNLNRVQFGLLDVGLPKCDLAARAIWELDPFATCVPYRQPLDDDTVGPFVADSDIVFDEVDDFRAKVQLRLMAQRHGKPLLMATNLGDTVLIDVERWDLQDDGLEPFNGQLDGVSLPDLMRADLSPEDVSRFAAQVIGVDNVPLRALASLPLINRELAGRPQVASTASMAAGAAAMAARSVLLGAPLRSGRYRLSLTEALGLPDDRGSEAEHAAIMARLRPVRPAVGLRPALHDPETLADDGSGVAFFTRLAAYATLAPSPHNTQPWQFLIADESLTIRPDPSRALAVADPHGRAMTISLGCSAMSVLVAAAASGVNLTVEIFTPAGDVRLRMADSASDPALARLFPALTSRVTDKRPYPPVAVDPPELTLPDGIGVHYVADPSARERLADLHRQAVTELARNGRFARELAGWLRADPDDPRRDGMTLPPGLDAAALITALSASAGPLREMGERDAQAFAAGPLIGVLTSPADNKAAWIHAGLAWQWLALTADTYGLAVAPLTAVVENPQTRQAAAAIVPAAAGQHIQMLFRLGRSPGPLPPTARRDPTWVSQDPRRVHP